MHQVEGYWKVQLVCLLIIVVFIAIAFFRQDTTCTNQEALENSSAITYVDRSGIV